MARHFAVEGMSEQARALIVRMYEDGATLEEIAAAVKEATTEEIGTSSLHRYCSRILEVERKSRQAIKRRIQAMMEASREDPSCDEAAILQAYSYEAALSNRDRISELDLKTLLQEQRRREESRWRMKIEESKIELEREKNEIQRLMLDFKREAAARVTRTAEEIVSQVKAKGLTDEAAAEIRSKILGINN